MVRFIHPVTRLEIREEDVPAFQKTDFKCIYPECNLWAITIHHCPPRSLNPDYLNQPDTFYPVCNKHHEKLHRMNWKQAQIMLVGERERLLK